MPTGGSLQRHRKFGHTNHNADMQQTTRFLNEQSEQDKEAKKAQKRKMYGSIKELMKREKKKKR
jgi:hypothetical protein